MCYTKKRSKSICDKCLGERFLGAMINDQIVVSFSSVASEWITLSLNRKGVRRLVSMISQCCSVGNLLGFIYPEQIKIIPINWLIEFVDGIFSEFFKFLEISLSSTKLRIVSSDETFMMCQDISFCFVSLLLIYADFIQFSYVLHFTELIQFEFKVEKSDQKGVYLLNLNVTPESLHRHPNLKVYQVHMNNKFLGSNK